MPSETSNHVSIGVGLITRGRPQMLAACLDSLAQMDRPAGCRVFFIIVENAETLDIGEFTARLSAKSGCKVVTQAEPKPGIPAARNRVLALAYAHGADHLTFIDDDETVAQDWLVRLWDHHEGRKLDLTGGPVVLAPISPEATWVERLIYAGWVARNEHVAARAAANLRRGHEDRVTVITNNWICRLETLRRAGIRFDESLRLSGGSDTLLFHQLKAGGAKTGWAVDACVHETAPPSRLTFGYQFRRGRDQAIASYNNRYRHRPGAVVRSAFFIAGKIFLGLLRLAGAPFNGGRSVVRAVRAFGVAWGRIQAVAGARSNHYGERHGD
jgi:succinoglycan biosynthesis protein ExoM